MNNLVFTSVYDLRQTKPSNENSFKENSFKVNTKVMLSSKKKLNIKLSDNLSEVLNLVKTKIKSEIYKFSGKIYKYIDNIVLNEQEINVNDNSIYQLEKIRLLDLLKNISLNSLNKSIKKNILSVIKKIKIFYSGKFHKTKAEINIDEEKSIYELFRKNIFIKNLKPALINTNKNQNRNPLMFFKNNFQYAGFFIVSIIYFSIWSFFKF